jgi:hypothetical protein
VIVFIGDVLVPAFESSPAALTNTPKSSVTHLGDPDGSALGSHPPMSPPSAALASLPPSPSLAPLGGALELPHAASSATAKRIEPHDLIAQAPPAPRQQGHRHLRFPHCRPDCHR